MKTGKNYCKVNGKTKIPIYHTECGFIKETKIVYFIFGFCGTQPRVQIQTRSGTNTEDES